MICFITEREASDINMWMNVGVLLQMFLTSDHARFNLCARKSRHNKVWLQASPGRLSEWCIKPYDPQFRMELEFTPVPVSHSREI